jgi:glycosyltransferase involved in cell wall biosynthesis
MPSPLAGRTIALVTRLYGPEPGVASYRLAALARALRDTGARVRVLTTTTPRQYRGSVPDHDGIEVRRVPVLRDRDDYVRGYLQYLSFDIPAFFRVLFSRGTDLFVVEPPPTTGLAVRAACALRRRPYVYYLADIWSDAVEALDEPGVVARLLRRVELAAVRGAAAVLSASQEFTDRLAELGVTGNVVTVLNGADERLFGPDGSVHQEDHPYLLYAGTASEMHGAGIFISALERVRESLPDARVVFVGSGAERAKLEADAERLPDGAVHFEPRLPPETTAEWIRGAAATLASVVPDAAYHRMFPVKMYASVTCGTPVIYAGSAPGRTFAELPGMGWAVDYDVDQVAAAMTSALTTPPDAADRRRRAGVGAAEYSLAACARRGVDAIAEVLAGRRRSR